MDRGDSGQGGLFKSDRLCRYDDGPQSRGVERLVLDQRVGQSTNYALVVLDKLQGALLGLGEFRPPGLVRLPAADRVTPFDRWLGLDAALVEEESPDQSAMYVDPTDVANYLTV